MIVQRQGGGNADKSGHEKGMQPWLHPLRTGSALDLPMFATFIVAIVPYFVVKERND